MSAAPAVAAIAPYWLIFRAGVRRQSTYWLATFGGLVANLTFGFLKAAVLFATVEAAGGSLKGYDLATMSGYVWLSQGLLGCINAHGRSEIGDRIKTGDIAIDFARPTSVFASFAASDLGGGAYSLLPRGLPSIAIGALTTGIALAEDVTGWVLGLLAVAIGMMLSFCGRYAVNILGLWLVETRGLQLFYMVTSTFLMGLFVPVGLFPAWLNTLAHCTPFPAMFMTPIDLLSGRIDGWAGVGAVGVQLAWLAGLAAVGLLLTRAGRRRLEVQGG